MKKRCGICIWIWAIVAPFFSISLAIDIFYEGCQCEPTPPPITTQSTIFDGKPNTRPPCLTWYTVHQNEHQWKIAKKFAPKGRNLNQWLESMRYMSHKAKHDDLVKPNETVCVKW